MARLEGLLRLLGRATMVVLLGDHRSHVAVTAGSESERKRSHRDCELADVRCSQSFMEGCHNFEILID